MKTSRGFVLLGILMIVVIMGMGGTALWLWHNSATRATKSGAAQNLNYGSTGPFFANQTNQSLFRHYIYYYTQDNKLYSVSADLEHQTDLSSKGVPIERDYGCQVLSSSNGDVLYFEKGSSIWAVKGDGTGLHQINTGLSVECDHDNGLVATNNDGSLLILYNQGTPDLKAGAYLYSSQTNRLTHLPRFDTDSFPQIQFINGKAQYLDGDKGILYQIDLDTGDSTAISSHPIPATKLSSDPASLHYLPGQPIIAVAIGDTGNPNPPNFSQILLSNYLSGEKAAISPKGKWAEYQFLETSPNFKHILYGHQIYDRTTTNYVQVIKTDYFEYDAATRTSKPWPIKAYPNQWIDDDSFVYFDVEDNELYGYNLESKSQQPIASDVQGIIY